MTDKTQIDNLSREVNDMRKDLSQIGRQIERLSVHSENQDKGIDELKAAFREFAKDVHKQHEDQNKKHTALLIKVTGVATVITMTGGSIILFVVKNLISKLG
jgi:peptidoglycan hydrolase CwlO-like protein